MSQKPPFGLLGNCDYSFPLILLLPLRFPLLLPLLPLQLAVGKDTK